MVAVLCDWLSTSPDLKLDTEVIIVGNGPAGLSLSTFLAGWLPFYAPNGKPHFNSLVHQKLTEHSKESLLDQTLHWLDNSINMMCTGARSISLLYDSLVHPDADTGIPGRSKLCWVFDPNREIPHLVIAETPVGGSWNNHDDDMVSISANSLLDLPVYSVADWWDKNHLDSRLPTAHYRKYLSDYAKVVQIRKNIICGINVKLIEKCCTNGQEFWEVHGTKNGESVLLRSKKVVLACGKNRDRLLGVSGELQEKRIVYNLRDLKGMLSSPVVAKYSDQKVVVVGDGLSAADAVLYCLRSSICVLHVIRRSKQQMWHTQLSRLSASVYPEYAQVYKLITGRSEDPHYSIFTSSTIESIDIGAIRIKTPLGIFTERFQVLCVCIGKQSDLSMLSDQYTFQDYQCREDPSLFRIGSLAEDHFVRYLVGGSMDVARCLITS